MSPLFAFLHHLAAFALVAALALQFVLIWGELTLGRARQLQVIDRIYGASAGLLLLVGLLRVFYFEKSAAYYFNNIPFIIKLSAFIIVGLLLIYPTVVILSWDKILRQGLVPQLTESQIRTIRKLLHWEMMGSVIIILCAALMAQGIGARGL